MVELFALLSLIGWGVGDIFSVLSARKIGHRLTLFFFLLISFLITSFYIPFSPFRYDPEMILLSLLLGFIHISGTLFLYRAFETGNTSIVGTISGSFPVIAVVIARIFFREEVSVLKLCAILMTFSGVLLTSYRKDSARVKHNVGNASGKYVIYSFLAMVCWGVYFGFVRVPAERIGWFWAAYAENIFFIMPLLFSGFRRELSSIKRLKTGWIVYPFMLVLFGRTADFSYNLGILNGFTSVVATISGAYPVLFVLLTRLIFKEPLGRLQKTGIILALGGIILISINY